MKVLHWIETYTKSGFPIVKFRVLNDTGAYVEFTNWGARWIAAVMPDVNDVLSDVLVGYEQFTDYLNDEYYVGATIGRVANRIANASFTIDGKTFLLDANDGLNTNHGGYSGFHNKIWQWEELLDGVRFFLLSPDGDGGYPGNIHVITDYRFNDKNELSVMHYAQADCSTYLNMTNHAYFNLSGTKSPITNHYLRIFSEQILDTTPEFLPTGRLNKVRNTPFDFTYLKQIRKSIYSDHEQIHWNKGYNHFYALKEQSSPELLKAAHLFETETGRSLTVLTDLPGVLIYTAGYYKYPDTGICFETQFYPDTPSHSSFPSCLLHLGETYRHYTIFRFGKGIDEKYKYE